MKILIQENVMTLDSLEHRRYVLIGIMGKILISLEVINLDVSLQEALMHLKSLKEI